MRILLDTNILVRAAITPLGLAREILNRVAADERHVLILSAHLLAEVADVLTRPRIRARWPLSDADVEGYCEALSGVGEDVALLTLPSVISDPKDQAIIEAAVAGRADVICTNDEHFYTSPAREFLAAQGITVLSDRDVFPFLAQD